MSDRLRFALVLAAAALFPATAFAHPASAAHAHSLADGMIHPLTGLDHVAAMLGVGLLATRFRGGSLWLIPAGFLAGMAGGLFLPLAAPPVMFEGGIALSLLVLGVLLAFAFDFPAYGVAAVALSAGLFHGAAHTAESAAGSPFAGFAAGALMATALLHGSGALLGAAFRDRLLFHSSGVALAGLGVALFANAVF